MKMHDSIYCDNQGIIALSKKKKHLPPTFKTRRYVTLSRVVKIANKVILYYVKRK